MYGRMFLGLELDRLGIKAMVIESGYKQALIKDACHVLFKDLPDSEENLDPFDAGMDMVAQQIDLQGCSTAIIFVSPLLVCFRNVDLPFDSAKKIKQILAFELETLLPRNRDAYISDFHLLANQQESNLILSASIIEATVEKYFLKLGSFGIKPLLVTPGGYAAAVGFLKENKELSTFVFVHVGDFEITLVLVNNQIPSAVRAFLVSQYSPEALAVCVKQTIMGFNQRTGSDISFDILVNSDGDNLLADRIYTVLKTKYQTGLRLKTDSAAQLSRMTPDKRVKYLFNFCQGQYGSSSFLKTYLSNIAAGVALFVIVFALFMVSFGLDNSKLNKQIAAIDNEAVSIFAATFPDKKKIQDPYLQMKANVREAVKKSGTSGEGPRPTKNKALKLVQIMGELSKAISSSIDMETSRFLFNNGRLVLSGSTDNFNNVDKIKSKIESSDLFERVSISSAAADKKTTGLTLNLLSRCKPIIMPDFSKREINVLILGITFVVLFFGYQFGVVAVMDKRDNLNRILNEKQAALEEMVLLRQQFLAVSNGFDTKTQALADRNKAFSLFSFLDSQAQQSGVKENVEYMKPFTKKIDNSLHTLATVKVKLKEVYLKELVDFLYHIESSKNGVVITSLSLSKAGKENRLLDAVIETQTLMLKDKA